jgi:hypothetical protein
VYEVRIANYSGAIVSSDEVKIEVNAAIQQTLVLTETSGKEVNLAFHNDGSFVALGEAGVQSGKYTCTFLASDGLVRARLVGDDGEFYITLLFNPATGVSGTYTIETLEEVTAASPVSEEGIFEFVKDGEENNL